MKLSFRLTLKCKPKNNLALLKKIIAEIEKINFYKFKTIPIDNQENLFFSYGHILASNWNRAEKFFQEMKCFKHPSSWEK
jgi:hypothetical protein